MLSLLIRLTSAAVGMVRNFLQSILIVKIVITDFVVTARLDNYTGDNAEVNSEKYACIQPSIKRIQVF
jgi:hypothetical protein